MTSSAPPGRSRPPPTRSGTPAPTASTQPPPTASSPVTAYENLQAAGFEQVVVTDTVPLPPGAPDNVKVLSCADLLTSSIRQIFTDGSVSDVFGGENQLF